MQLTLAALTELLQTTLDSTDTEFNGLSIDSRTLQPGNLFIAIPGARVDGHDFLAMAQQNGAVAALVQRKVDSTLPQILVADTVAALGKMAAFWRKQFNIPVIAVTGSCGKTTLKNMIASILTAACGGDASQVLATTGNFNNHIGLPLSLARLNAKHRYAVLEIGMNHPGEIAYLSPMAQPTIAVINNAAAAHLEGVGNIEGVARAKGEIFLGLSKDGLGILNYDDPYFELWRELLKNRDYLTFGVEYAADVTAEIPVLAQSDKQNFVIQTPAGDMAICLPMPGKHNIMNALAATAATIAIDIHLAAIKKGLENVPSTAGRLQVHQLAQGIRLIDDTYNANPSSVEAAAITLADQPGVKILVLGDMRELGSDAEALHTATGEKIRAAGIDYLFTYGELSAATAKAYGEKAQHFHDQDSLANALKPFIKPPVTILVKGSRSMKMENVVAKLREPKPEYNN